MFEISIENRRSLLVIENTSNQRVINQPFSGERGLAFIPDPFGFLDGWRPIGECFVNTLQPVMFYSGIGWVFDIETYIAMVTSSVPSVRENFGIVHVRASHESPIIRPDVSEHQIGFMFVGRLDGGWIHVGN